MQYPDYYTPKPYSKSFVLHLDSWYAQSHPDEDFAETFAAWLTPDADWRTRYADWPALKKLEYMDGLMKELAGKPMLVRTRRKVEPLQSLRKTLRSHYARKRRHYGVEHPHFYDRDLRRLFSDSPDYAGNMKAARFIARLRREIRRMVAANTGEYRYTIDQVLENMITRANEMNLRLDGPRGSDQTGFRHHADRADDELPAQRQTPGRVVTSHVPRPTATCDVPRATCTGPPQIE